MEKVKVRAYRPSEPLPLIAEGRGEIRTERLILRPFTLDVLQDMHSLRIQPEVMAFTRQGRPDKDVAESFERIKGILPPNDAATYNWALYEAATGEFVGAGGFFSYSALMGWAELGYMLKREHWGKGYATEFVRAWLEAWWKLPRSEVLMEVALLSVAEVPVGADGVREVGKDRVMAVTTTENGPSRKVLEKSGFREVMMLSEPDVRPGFEGVEVMVHGFVAVAPE